MDMTADETDDEERQQRRIRTQLESVRNALRARLPDLLDVPPEAVAAALDMTFGPLRRGLDEERDRQPKVDDGLQPDDEPEMEDRENGNFRCHHDRL